MKYLFKKKFVAVTALFALGCLVFVGVGLYQGNLASAATQGVKLMKAADPSIISTNGQYYGVYVSSGTIYAKSSTTVAGLGTATAKKIWSKSGASEVWAPEIVKYNGQYYVYFTYGSGTAHRMYVISSATPDSGYGTEVAVTLPDNKWAIDGTLFTANNDAWFAWSGWEGNTNGQQNLYIAKMSSPSAATGARYAISKPTTSWERKSGGSLGLPYVNEAPEPIVDPNGQLHISFSANGYWSQYYCVADLRLRTGGDMTNINDWYKSNGCLFSSKDVMAGAGTVVTNSQGSGHHTFILPDGDASKGPALGTSVPFAYAAVPKGTLYLPDLYRYWYSGVMSWQTNVTYVQGTASDVGLAPKFTE